MSVPLFVTETLDPASPVFIVPILIVAFFPGSPLSPVLPSTPSRPDGPGDPVSPFGITKSSIASVSVPRFLITTLDPGSPVVTVPNLIVAVRPVFPVSPVSPFSPGSPLRFVIGTSLGSPEVKTHFNFPSSTVGTHDFPSGPSDPAITKFQ